MKERNTNRVRTLIAEGKKVAAGWLQSANPIAAEIMAESGFDVLMIDLEHGPGDILSTIGQVQAMKNEFAVPFARAPWNDFVQIKRILDAGIMGLVVPYVNTKQQAVAAVEAAAYPVAGVRGVAGSPRAAGYGNNAGEYLRKICDEIVIMTAVETPEAVKNLDDILEVARLDGIFIGPMDLATGMGYFGDPSHKEVQKAIAEIEEKVLASGKLLSTVAGTWEQAAEKYERGYHMVVFFSDTVSLGQAARQRMEQFRKQFDLG